MASVLLDDDVYTGPVGSANLGAWAVQELQVSWEVLQIPPRVGIQFQTPLGSGYSGMDALLAREFDLPVIQVANSNGFVSPNQIFREDVFLTRYLRTRSGTIVVPRFVNTASLRTYIGVPRDWSVRVRLIQLD